MNKDTRLSSVLHVLIHLDQADEPLTSEVLAKTMGTNSAVFRRTMAGLREAGYVRSGKGHGGGWQLEKKLSEITLFDVFDALEHSHAFSFGLRNENTTCKVEKAVNTALSSAMKDAHAALLAGFRSVTLNQIANQSLTSPSKR